MDRIAALADIIPPAPPPPLPPAAWWQLPAVWLAAALVTLVVGWTLLWLHRSRRWRRLGDAAAQISLGSTKNLEAVSMAHRATALAAQLRAVLPESDWPSALRLTLDTLRFAPWPVTEALAALQQTATAIQAASRQAAHAAWRPANPARAVFARALRLMAEDAMQPTSSIQAQIRA